MIIYTSCVRNNVGHTTNVNIIIMAKNCWQQHCNILMLSMYSTFELKLLQGFCSLSALIYSVCALQTGQHSPSGVTDISPGLHITATQFTLAQSSPSNSLMHRAQHSPGRVKLIPSTHCSSGQSTVRQFVEILGPVL